MIFCWEIRDQYVIAFLPVGLKNGVQEWCVTEVLK